MDSAKSKMIKIKKQLETTYKTSGSADQRKRVALQIKNIEHELEGFGEFDEEIDLGAMDFIADIVDQEQHEESFSAPEDAVFSSKIAIERVSGKAADDEMDEIYSYLLFFHRNFYTVLQSDSTRLDHKHKGKMEDAFIHYNHIQKYLQEYKNDVAMMDDISREGELELYRQRLEEQKNHFIMKLNKVLKEFQGLLGELTADESLYKALLNPSELFSNSPSLPYFSIYEGQAIFDILTECIRFIQEYRPLLRAPEIK